MLVHDPAKRWTAEQLLTLPVFKKAVVQSPLKGLRSYGSTYNFSVDHFQFSKSKNKKHLVVRTRKYNEPVVIEPKSTHRLSKLTPIVSYSALPKVLMSNPF